MPLLLFVGLWDYVMTSRNMQAWNLADMHLETEDTLCQNNSRTVRQFSFVVKQTCCSNVHGHLWRSSWTGLWTGLLDWTDGLDWWTGLLDLICSYCEILTCWTVVSCFCMSYCIQLEVVIFLWVVPYSSVHGLWEFVVCINVCKTLVASSRQYITYHDFHPIKCRKFGYSNCLIISCTSCIFPLHARECTWVYMHKLHGWMFMSSWCTCSELKAPSDYNKCAKS